MGSLFEDAPERGASDGVSRGGRLFLLILCGGGWGDGEAGAPGAGGQEGVLAVSRAVALPVLILILPLLLGGRRRAEVLCGKVLFRRLGRGSLKEEGN